MHTELARPLAIGKLHDMSEATATWHVPVVPHIGRIADFVAKGIAMLETEHRAVLPDLRRSARLGLACDFSGQHQASAFDVYSFLLFDADRHVQWEAPRRRIREQMIRDARRISFKNLRDNVQWNALRPFLEAAGQLPGVLFTLAVAKNFSAEFLLGEGFRIADFEDVTRFNEWNVGTVMKAITVVHIASVLVAGLGAAGQDLIWLVDQDEIVEDEVRMATLAESFRDVISDYLSFEMGGFQLVTASSDPGDRHLEDLLSISDLAAGAWWDMFNTVHSAQDLAQLRSLVSAKSDRTRERRSSSWSGVLRTSTGT